MKKLVLCLFVLVLLNLAFVNAETCLSESKCNRCPGNQDTPKSYTLTVEDVKNCADDSLSELNGEYELIQSPDSWGSCMWEYSGNIISVMLIADNWENDGGFGISVIPYTPYGDTMYFKFYPDLCTETMETDIREEHSICDSSGNPDNIYGGKATLTPCKTPEINLTIYPEYDELKTDPFVLKNGRLYYESVFTKFDAGKRYLEPYVQIEINDSFNREQFYVNWTMQINNSKNEIVYLKNDGGIYGKSFRIDFPYKNVSQDDLLIFQAQVCDLEINCDENKGRQTVYRYTPKFDVFVKNIDSGNSIFNISNLVERKPIATRALIKINSSVKKINSPGNIAIIKDYIDAIRDIHVNLLVDGKKEMESTQDLVNYEDIEVLKAKVDDKSLSDDEREKAMILLSNIHKKANDTRNFIGYIPWGKTGQIILQVAIEGDINEFNSTNNNLSKTYNLRSQKDPMFRFAFTGMNVDLKGGKSFALKDYDSEKILINASYDFFKSAFPFDPIKVSSITAKNPGLFKRNSEYGLKILEPDFDVVMLQGLQKVANEQGYDMIFAVIPSDASNLIKKGMSGETIPSISKNAALITEGESYGAYAHEAGHLFGLYNDKEQKSGPPCDESGDLGLLASDGWCMNERGEGCNRFASYIPLGFNGEIISVWHDRDGTQGGCYSGEDGPYWHHNLPFTLKYLSPPRKFDIMSGVHDVWPTQNPTYNKLMEKILS